MLDYEPEQPRAVEPLMGWTSSGDMRQQLRLSFDTKEEAVAYCERARHSLPDRRAEDRRRAERMSYSDNFAFTRRGAWTH